MSTTPAPGLRIEGVETSRQRKGLAGKLGWATLALLMGPLLLAFLLDGLGVRFEALGAILGWSFTALPFVGLAALVLRFFRWRRPGAAEIDGGDLLLERGRYDERIPLRALVEGHVSPKLRMVELSLRGGDVVRVHVPSVEDGQRLLEATGLDASHRTMRLLLGETTFLDALSILLGSVITTMLAALVGFMTPWEGPVTTLLAIALWPLLFVSVRALLGPAELVIGADGIIIHQGFRARFLPFAQITAIDAEHAVYAQWPSDAASSVIFRLKDGGEARARTRYLTAEQCAELLARLEDACRAWGAGDRGAQALARLDREGRDLAAWRASLRALTASRGGGYREPAALARDALVAVLESPSAPIERRLGAALALSSGDDPETRARIRVAAAACANTRVRVALERAAEDTLDDEAIDEALATEEGGAPPRVQGAADGRRAGS